MTASTPPPGSDRNPSRRTLDLVRIGVVLGACLALALSAVVVLGASPAPTGPGADSKASADPGKADHRSGFPRGLLGLRDFLGGTGGQGLAGGRGGFGAVGRSIAIASIDGSTIGLKTDDGWTRTITVGADTKIDKDGKTATVGDLKVGDRLILREQRNADGSYTVTGLSVYLPVVAGTVSAINGNDVTIKLRDGSTRTVTLTGSTTFKVGPTDGAMRSPPRPSASRSGSTGSAARSCPRPRTRSRSSNATGRKPQSRSAPGRSSSFKGRRRPASTTSRSGCACRRSGRRTPTDPWTPPGSPPVSRAPTPSPSRPLRAGAPTPADPGRRDGEEASDDDSTPEATIRRRPDTDAPTRRLDLPARVDWTPPGG